LNESLADPPFLNPSTLPEVLGFARRRVVWTVIMGPEVSSKCLDHLVVGQIQASVADRALLEAWSIGQAVRPPFMEQAVMIGDRLGRSVVAEITSWPAMTTRLRFFGLW
jgi:hypothetical protein